MILATLTLALPLFGAAPADGEDDVARVFDVSSLAFAPSPLYNEQMSAAMLPLMRQLHTWSDSGERRSDQAAEALTSTFLEHFGDEVDRLDMFPDGQVFIRGTEAAVDRFGAFLAFFEAAQASGPELEIIRFEAPDGGIGTEMERGLLLGLLEGMEARSSRERVRVPMSGQLRIFDGRSTSASIAAEVEIAQAMAIHHASVRDVLTGFELLLWTGPDRDGLRASYIISQLDRAPDRSMRPVGAEVRLSTLERGMRVTGDASWTESLAVSGGALAGELRLRPGRFTVLRLRADGESGHYIALGLASAVPPAVTLDVGNGRSLRALGRGALGRPRLVLESPAGAHVKSLSRVASSVLGSSDTILRASLGHGEWELMHVVLEDLQTAFVEVPGGILLVFDTEKKEQVDRRLGLLASALPPQLHVHVRAGGGPDRPSRAASLVATSGSEAAVVIGEEGLTAKQYNVEVAQHSGSREPIVETHFEGFMMTLMLSKLGDGRLGYSLEGQLSDDLASEEASANSLGGNGLMGYESAHLGLRAFGAVAPDPDGGWTIEIGDLDGQGQRVTLEVNELE